MSFSYHFVIHFFNNPFYIKKTSSVVFHYFYFTCQKLCKTYMQYWFIVLWLVAIKGAKMIHIESQLNIQIYMNLMLKILDQQISFIKEVGRAVLKVGFDVWPLSVIIHSCFYVTILLTNWASKLTNN